MSKAVIGLVGHVLKRLGDRLMALFRDDAPQENDAEHTARHFDERGDKIERKEIRDEAFGPGNKRSPGRLLSRRRRRRSGDVLGCLDGLGGSGQLGAQPINAAMSTLAVQAAGAAAISIAKAIAPSILPDERFFDSLRLPAAIFAPCAS